MSEDFARKIGELTGQLRYFMPALEKQEKKVDEALKAIERCETKLDLVMRDLSEQKKRATEHHNLIYQKIDKKQDKGECADHDDIKNLQKQIDDIEKDNETAGDRKFEVWKIVLTAVVSALVPTIIAVIVFFSNVSKGGP